MSQGKGLQRRDHSGWVVQGCVGVFQAQSFKGMGEPSQWPESPGDALMHCVVPPLLLRIQPFLPEQGPPQPLTAFSSSPSSSPCVHAMPTSVDGLGVAFGEEADWGCGGQDGEGIDHLSIALAGITCPWTKHILRLITFPCRPEESTSYQPIDNRERGFRMGVGDHRRRRSSL